MIYNIIWGILFIIFGVLLIIDSLTYKFSKAFESENFNRWLYAFLCIGGGIYIILTTIFGK